MPTRLRTLWTVTLLAALALTGCAATPALPIFPTPEAQSPPPATTDAGLIAMMAILALALAVVVLSRRTS
jgi:hypothetical protein